MIQSIAQKKILNKLTFALVIIYINILINTFL